MLNIAVLVSGGGTNLQVLLDAQAYGEIVSGRISLVLSSKDGVYALERATQASVKTAVLAKQKDETPAQYGQKLITELLANDIDMVVLAGFMLILDECFIKAYEGRILNIHPSLIPAFCGEGFYGLRVHRAALERGVKLTGATVHIVNEIPDGGPILAQKAIEVLDGDTPEILQQRVMEQAEWILLPRETEKLAASLTKLR
ncbi:MAG: phosphoribosylglycinamide formyltransferase [Clostridiales bacterium]|nr:phosphoribosylglycinamide formyltransferase [Clostridiales bacterium]